jgi:hypothetical protein
MALDLLLQIAILLRWLSATGIQRYFIRLPTIIFVEGSVVSIHHARPLSLKPQSQLLLPITTAFLAAKAKHVHDHPAQRT